MKKKILVTGGAGACTPVQRQPINLAREVLQSFT